MSGFLNSLLPTLILLGGLIFIHELGHFWAAKLVNIEVKRFSLGLGPVIWSRTWGETEYALSAIPLGGYVKMGGMADEVMERVEGGGDPESDEEVEDGAREAEPRAPGPRDFDGKPLWARAFVISAGVAMNFAFALIAYIAIVGFWGVPVTATTRVGMIERLLVPPGSEAVLEIPAGAELVSVGGRDVSNWLDVQEGVIEAEGADVAFELDDGRSITVALPAALEDRESLAGALVPWTEPVIGGVEPGSPADRGGIEPGDRILGLDAQPIPSWFEFVDAVEPRPEQRVDIRLEREGSVLVRTVELGSRPKDDATGATREDIGFAGVVPAAGPFVDVQVGLVESVVIGWDTTIRGTSQILAFLRDLVTGRSSPRNVGSIVMIGQISGQAAEAGVEVFLGFMAIFSLNLAILNLLPIPVLDGGHLVFLAIEAVRGKAVSMDQRIRWSNVGLIVLMFIMVWALGNDFLRVFGL